MVESPERGRTASGWTAQNSPARGNHLWDGAGSVLGPSTSVVKSVSPVTATLILFACVLAAAAIASIDEFSLPPLLPPGASESGERSEPVRRASPEGEREAERASEGGPTGTTENGRRWERASATGGSGSLSSGWREVAVACHALGGMSHE